MTQKQRSVDMLKVDHGALRVVVDPAAPNQLSYFVTIDQNLVPDDEYRRACGVDPSRNYTVRIRIHSARVPSPSG